MGVGEKRKKGRERRDEEGREAWIEMEMKPGNREKRRARGREKGNGKREERENGREGQEGGESEKIETGGKRQKK